MRIKSKKDIQTLKNLEKVVDKYLSSGAPDKAWAEANRLLAYNFEVETNRFGPHEQLSRILAYEGKYPLALAHQITFSRSIYESAERLLGSMDLFSTALEELDIQKLLDQIPTINVPNETVFEYARNLQYPPVFRDIQNQIASWVSIEKD